MDRKALKNTLYLYLCFFLWVISERVWYLGLRHVSRRGRRSEHAAESLKRRETKAPREISPSSARSSDFVFVNAVFRILWVGVSCIFACLYFWGTFAPHTSQVLEAGEMWEGGALVHKARRCLNEVPPQGAPQITRVAALCAYAEQPCNLRFWTLPARQKWRQSGKWRWWISRESEKANGRFLAVFPISALQELNSLNESNN